MPTLVDNIHNLYAEIAAFEKGGAFSADSFNQNLKGILSAFELLRNQQELGGMADDALYTKIRDVEPTDSQLRFLASHILGMYLEAWAHGPSGYRRSYQDLLRFRPDEARVDADFIERVLLPRLLTLKELGGHGDLGYHLLLHLADYLQTFGAPPTLPARPARRDLEALPPSQLLLGFARRKLGFPGQRLVDMPDAWEYGLSREGYFAALRAQGRKQGLDLEAYLIRLDLLKKIPWWKRLLDAIGRFFRAVGGWIGARLEKLPAGGVFWSAFWVAFSLAVIVGITVMWLGIYDHKLRDFKGKGMSAEQKTLEVPK